MSGSLVNVMMGDSAPVPTVGMGATRLGYTDRHAMTIVKVNATATSVWATNDEAKRVDSNGMSESQAYEYTSDMDVSHATEYTKRKNGAWVAKGEGIKHGQRIAIGHRETYHDYSF